MAQDIPFARLGIPLQLEPILTADSRTKLPLASGLVPMTADVQIAALYVLALDEDPEVARRARRSFDELPTAQILGAINMKTHAKVLEYLAEFRTPDPEVDDRIAMMRTANDRTVRLLARRASASLCEQLSQNHERLLMAPELYLDLYANPECSEAAIGRAESFLRMHRSLPQVTGERPAPAAEPQVAAPVSGLDLEAEIEAMLAGQQSPALLQQQEQSLDMFKLDGEDAPDEDLGLFRFDFSDDTDLFTWDLTADAGGSEDDPFEQRRSVEHKIAKMTVGQKIKLAYLGNKEVRGVLIRDPNKIVSSAVVRSGRLSDQEVANFAGNKNLDNDVLREIATNGEWLRKYPVKVALVNNPKTPVSVAVGIVSTLQKRDLLALTRNRNVPSVITQAANRLFKQKFRK